MSDYNHNEINDVPMEKEASHSGKGGRPVGSVYKHPVATRLTDAQNDKLLRMANLTNTKPSDVFRRLLDNTSSITIHKMETSLSKQTLTELGRQGKNLSTLFTKHGNDLNDDVKNLLEQMIKLNKEVRLGFVTKAVSHDC